MPFPIGRNRKRLTDRRTQHVVILTLIGLLHVLMIGLVVCMPSVLWLYAQRKAGFAVDLDADVFIDAPFVTLVSVLVVTHCSVFVLTVRLARTKSGPNKKIDPNEKVGGQSDGPGQ